MSEYNEQRAAFDKAVKTFEGNNSFAAARALLLSGEKTVSCLLYTSDAADD